MRIGFGSMFPNRQTGGKVIKELAGILLFPAMKQKVACIGQMICHETRGKFGIASFDCDQDGPMEVEGVFEVD